MFFYGGYASAMDAKGRLVIPAKFRADLGEDSMLVKGFDKCVYIYPREQFEKVVSDLNLLRASSAESRSLSRHILGAAADCQFDAMGRITVPKSLRDYANLQKDIVVSGVNNRIELWERSEYEKYESENSEMIEAAVEKSNSDIAR